VQQQLRVVVGPKFDARPPLGTPAQHRSPAAQPKKARKKQSGVGLSKCSSKRNSRLVVSPDPKHPMPIQASLSF
jgi:hypothetical protein